MVCFNIHGHAFYLEDGIEHANTYKNNLIVQVKPGAMICTDERGAPGAAGRRGGFRFLSGGRGKV